VTGRSIVAAAAGLALIAALAGCASPRAGDDPSDSASPEPREQPPPLEVLCDENLVLSVSGETVEAGSAGVAVLVTSDAPPGAYLHYEYGGDEMPPSPSTWLLVPPPGEWELSCATLEVEGDPVTVTVVDPGGYWSARTIEDYGCPMGAIPSWAIGGGSGSTPEEAVAALAASFNDSGIEPPLTRWEHAGIGYRDSADQTWIVGTDDVTHLTAIVTGGGQSFSASPNWLCVPNPWSVPADE